MDARLSAGAFRLDVQLAIDRGPLLLVGPNGSGKSTLLRALAGGPVDVDGRIALGAEVLVDTAHGVFLPPERRRVGYLPQGFRLFPHLTALDNVAFGVEGDRDARRAHARRLLDELGVAALADRRPAGLSGGEAQRVALARALARRPALLLLDEPTASLDVQARRAARELLASRLASLPTVAVTHDVRDVEAWGGAVALVRDGRVHPPRPWQQLVDDDDPFLRELLWPLAR